MIEHYTTNPKDEAILTAIKSLKTFAVLKLTNIGKQNLIDNLKKRTRKGDRFISVVIEKYGDAALIQIEPPGEIKSEGVKVWYPYGVLSRIPIVYRREIGTIMPPFKPDEILTLFERDIPDTDSNLLVYKDKLYARLIEDGALSYTSSVNAVPPVRDDMIVLSIISERNVLPYRVCPMGIVM